MTPDPLSACSAPVSGDEGARPAETVLRYYALVDAGQTNDLLALFDPAAVYCRPGYEPMRGMDALGAFYRGGRVIASGRHEIADLVVQGGRVAVRGMFTGTSRTGEPLSTGFSDFFDTSPTGAIVSRWTYFAVPSV